MVDHSSALPQWCSDAETTLVVEANDAALRFWRYARDEFIGMPAIRLLFEEELPRQRLLAKLNQWGETGPWKCRRGDGSVVFTTVRWQRVVRKDKLCDFVFVHSAGDSIQTLEPLDEVKKVLKKVRVNEL